MSDYSDKLLIEVGVFFCGDECFDEEDVPLLKELPPAVLDKIVKMHQRLTAHPDELLELAGFLLLAQGLMFGADINCLKQLPLGALKELAEARQRYKTFTGGPSFDSYLCSLGLTKNRATLNRNFDDLNETTRVFRAIKQRMLGSR